MTPTKETAQASARPAKTGKDAVEKLNAQVLRTVAFLDGLEKSVAASLAHPETRAASKVSLRVALEAVSGDVARAKETAAMVSQGLHRLHKEKWKPVSGARPLGIGDAVAVRDHEIKRFDGAWPKEDLRALVVVSVHGKKAKCQIKRDGLAGEVVGLVPLRWLQARAA